VTRRIWLRAAALALALVGVVVALTIYFSTESVPPCGVSGTAKWRALQDEETHRYTVVFPDRAACFFDEQHRLVAQLGLDDARHITSAEPNGSDIALRTSTGPYTLDLRTGSVARGGLAPFPSDFVTATDKQAQRLYVTQRGLLGVRVIDMRSGRTSEVVRFKGFTWNPRFGPDPPSHGLSLARDRPELWVLDAPNRALHVFDVSEAPRHVTDVRLEQTMSQPGSLTLGADGRFLYVGDSGAVVDTRSREQVAQLPALAQASAVLEVDWVDGKPVYPGFPR
jgi:hypothetical protein